MNIVQGLGVLSGRRTSAVVDQEIRDEIEFHIQSHASELIAQGWTSEKARSEAERRFGNQDQVLLQCKSIQTGSMIWLTRISLFGIGLSVMVIGYLSYVAYQLKLQNNALAFDLRQAVTAGQPKQGRPTMDHLTMVALESAVPETAKKEPELSLKGKITSDDGKPIAHAKILLIHKSWPNRAFQMDNDVTETDEEGDYVFQNLYNSMHQNEFLVTALADGFEMKSDYVSIKPNKKASSVNLKLKSAREIVFQVIGPDKMPLAETDVVLMSRKTGSKEHLIYPISIEDAKTATDAQGNLKISNLNEGDLAKFVIIVFGNRHEVQVKVSKDERQTIELVKIEK